MHADDFRQDRYGVVSGLRDGGYSDDMTLAALAGNTIVCVVDSFFLFPLTCFFFSLPQVLTRGSLHLLLLLYSLILLQLI